VWNVFLAAGLIAVPLGYNHGLEAGELPLLAEIPIFFCTVVVTEIKAIGSRRCANAAAQFLERPHLVP
jgi:hypothetical protein